MGIDPELLVWTPRQQIVVPAMPPLISYTGDGAALREFRWSEIVRYLDASNVMLAAAVFRQVEPLAVVARASELRAMVRDMAREGD